jgi:hypothetical protein
VRVIALEGPNFRAIRLRRATNDAGGLSALLALDRANLENRPKLVMRLGKMRQPFAEFIAARKLPPPRSGIQIILAKD